MINQRSNEFFAIHCEFPLRGNVLKDDFIRFSRFLGVCCKYNHLYLASRDYKSIRKLEEKRFPRENTNYRMMIIEFVTGD